MTNSAVGLRSERGPILLAIMVATGVVAIDATILATAVPAVVAELGGFAQFPWLFSIYLLTQSVTVPVYAKLADTFGRKRIVLFGIVVFLLASLLCGLAWDMPSLIVFRALQGIGGGAILPVTTTIIGDIYTVAERARVQGYVASVWGIAAVAGPALGGIFAELDIWRGIFFINIPLCAVAFWLLLRGYHEKLQPRKHTIDVAGAVLLTIAFSLLLLAVLEGGNSWEWLSVPSLTLFATGGITLLAFVLVERRAVEPVLPLWVFRRPLLRATNLIGLAVGATLIGLSAYVPTYLVVGLGVSPLVAGFALATLTIGWPISATFAGRFYLKIGYRRTILMGALFVLVGVVALTALSPAPSVLMVAAVSFVIGVGFGFASVPSLVAAQSSVGWAERGVVTGAAMFSRTIGQALGAALLGAIANGVIASLGGDDTDAATIIQASSAVFAGAAVIAVLLLVASVAMPREEHPPFVDPEPSTDSGPLQTIG